MRRRIAFAVAALGVCTVLAAGGQQSAAVEVADLYQGQTIVTGEGPANRPAGFAECLEDVLVKVSGDPLLVGDPAAAEFERGAAALVAQFRYHDRMAGIPHHDEQGTRDRPYDLVTRFDPAKIDAALRALGRKPWPAERPRLVVFLAMRNLTTGFVVAENGDRVLEREALHAAAIRRGVPILLPSAAALERDALGPEAVTAAEPARLDGEARALGGDVALAGRMGWDDAATSWVAEWRLVMADRVHRWTVRSLTFDEGFRQALGGAARILSGNGEPG